MQTTAPKKEGWSKPVLVKLGRIGDVAAGLSARVQGTHT